jgi:hypothetical protein
MAIENLDDVCVTSTSEALIRHLIEEDITLISETFNQIGWNKPPSFFIRYLK